MAISECQRNTSDNSSRATHSTRSSPPSNCQRPEEQQGGSGGGNQVIIIANSSVTGTRRSQEAGREGQCLGPQDHLRDGEQVSMSQRGPASRPASPSFSKSPKPYPGGGEWPSVDDGAQEGAGVPRTNGERPHPLTQRSLGVHNILNPAESLTTMSQSRPGEGDNTAPSPSGGQYDFSSNPPTPRPFIFQAHHRTPSQQQGNLPMSYGHVAQRPLSAGRASPVTGHLHQAIGPPRRFLTPRSPRASSMGHTQPFPILNPQPQHPVGTGAGQRRPFVGELGAEQSPHLGPIQEPLVPHLGRGGPPGTLPLAGRPSSSLATPTRSLSQPTLGHFGLTPQEQQQQQQQHGQPRQNVPPIPHLPPSTRGLPPTFPPDARQWPGSFEGTRGMRGIPVMEGGHHILTIHPQQGEEFYVPVDMEQASRKKGEKREKNAKASSRFRARKKEREQKTYEALDQLQAQSRELEARVRELEMERDRYRAERDRLRDIVARTSGISELAHAGPTSPQSMRSGGSPRSGVHGPPPPPLQPAVAYGAADPETGERASRRRRTVEYTSPSYAPMPIPSPTFVTPMSQPDTPSAAARTAILPPLRLDQPPGAPASAPPSTSELTLPFPAYKREPYESGWATRQNNRLPGPPDPGQH